MTEDGHCLKNPSIVFKGAGHLKISLRMLETRKRKVPEGFRKTSRKDKKPVAEFEFQKVPEGFRKVGRKAFCINFAGNAQEHKQT